MLSTFDIGIDNALAFQMSGKITENDMLQILAEARKKIQQHEHIVILEQIDSFSGIELKALMEEFKYLRELGMKNIHKVAIVTDKNWIDKMAHVTDKVLRDIDIQCFPLSEKDQAIEFLKMH